MGSWCRDQEVCATCRYWGGKREIDFTGTFYETKEDEGICNEPFGGFYGYSMPENSCCGQWSPFRDK